MLNVKETAARLGLKPWSVRQMIAAEILPVYRTGPKGRTVRISESDLAAYIASRRSPVRAAPTTAA